MNQQGRIFTLRMRAKIRILWIEGLDLQTRSVLQTPTNSPNRNQYKWNLNMKVFDKTATPHKILSRVFSQACSHKIWPSLWPFCGKSGEKNTGILTTTFRWMMKLSALYEKITYDMWVGCQGLEHDGMQQLTFWFGCRSHYDSSLEWESLFPVEKRLSYAIVVG